VVCLKIHFFRNCLFRKPTSTSWISKSKILF